LEKKAGSLTDNDNLLIFYAGHGKVKKVNGTIVSGYIIPSDAKNGNFNTYIRGEEIREPFKYSEARHILFVMDACFAGALTRSGMDDAKQYIQDEYRLKSRKMLTSGNLEEVPDKSNFFLSLKNFLVDNQEKYFSANDLYNYIRKNNKGGVMPQYERIADLGDGGGAFIFIRKDQ
jgi:hypothetical protein